ncbi:hypothetical protein CTA1_2252, partial [Colletotrichum tanaceti]
RDIQPLSLRLLSLATPSIKKQRDYRGGTLYTSFCLAKGITLSLLSIALKKGVIDILQTRATRRDLKLQGKHHIIPN